jgi:hypothetical protein
MLCSSVKVTHSFLRTYAFKIEGQVEKESIMKQAVSRTSCSYLACLNFDSDDGGGMFFQIVG